LEVLYAGLVITEKRASNLDKAESYARQLPSLAEPPPRPETQRRQETTDRPAKGLALSTLGQVNMQKKNNAQAFRISSARRCGEIQ